MLLLLVACGGPDEDTLIDELRVVAITAEPPEVAPGASSTLTTTVVDPTAAGADLLVWTCTNLGDGCLEAATPGMGTTVGTPVDGQLVTERAAPVELAAIVGDGETVLPVFTWALACVPGLCPILDLAAAAPAPGSADGDALAALLVDPFTMMEDLPLQGTSLALTTLSVSSRAEPVVNPVLTPTFEAISAAPEAAATLGFDVVAGATAYGYTTLGGFEMPAYDVVEGHVDLTWFAPADASSGDTAEFYVVVNGPDGGSALWRGSGSIP